MSKYEIIDFDEQYLDYLFKIHKENFMEYFVEHFGKWNDNRQFKTFCKMVGSGNFKMIKYNGNIIGMLNYQKGVGKEEATIQFQKDFSNLEMIDKSCEDYVVPAQVRYINIDRKYQNLGIGSAILRDIVNECRYEGIPAFLKVYRENDAALRLYHNIGFREDESNSDKHYRFMRLDNSASSVEEVEKVQTDDTQNEQDGGDELSI